jgi:hypothetical protein
MTLSKGRKHSNWSGLALSQLLALVFLAACLWWVYRELEFVLPNHRIIASLSLQRALGSVLSRQLAAFGVAVLLCHLLVGLGAFALARLTEVAFTGIALARRGSLITGWFVLLVGLVMAANATWHPASMFAGPDSWLLTDVGGFRPVEIGLLVFFALILFLTLRAARRIRVRNPRFALGFGGAGALALLAGVLLAFADSGPSHAGVTGASPNVIILGVDSLRQDLTEARNGAVVTPNIDRFLAGAIRFSDATSPLARTYPAWVSILTGRHPVATNARFNLMPRSLVHEGVTLPDALSNHGYRTIYATDEVRFANFDESYGFDQLVTPPVGAVDFLLGYAGDVPLVNLLATTAAGGLLFPSNHANRAANVTYEPEDFVARLENEIVVDGPAFIAIHLTLAHWPYSWATAAAPTTPQEYRPAYRRAIEEVDRQFENVLRMLARKGLLENSLVVVLSDHGEALGGKTDSMLRATGSSREIWDSLWGHGTSVMSPHQYGVVLAMRAFGRAQLAGAAGAYDWPVSLLDLRPTLEEFATGKAPSGIDGISLLPLLANPSEVARIDSRVRFTETDFNTPSTLAGRYEASGIIDEAAVFYELNPATGWVQFRSSRLPLLMTRKQRAAFSRNSLLAAIPGPAVGSISYLFTDRHTPLPRRLAGRPDPAADPEAARLWDELHARFAGELPADSSPPLM